MHLLPCPHCQASLNVSNTEAGGSTVCPSCQGTVPIPKLGVLRTLPVAETEPEPDPRVRGEAAERSPLFQVGYGLAGLIAGASLLIAGFSGIRWALSEVPPTTNQHVATMRQELSERTAAELIREYERMEKQSIDLAIPFKYKELAMRRAKWGRNASIAASVGVVALLVATVLATRGRRKTR